MFQYPFSTVFLAAFGLQTVAFGCDACEVSAVVADRFQVVAGGCEHWFFVQKADPEPLYVWGGFWQRR